VTGGLRSTLEEACADAGCKAGEMTVLAPEPVSGRHALAAPGRRLACRASAGARVAGGRRMSRRHRIVLLVVLALVLLAIVDVGVRLPAEGGP
jgi:hypothetical protein